MTRINVIPAKELCNEHLVAEYREITRLPSSLFKSLNRKSTPFNLNEIPTQYTLGAGHVKFFFDKMLFLKNRFEQLVNEMQARGFKTTYTDSSLFLKVEPMFLKDYTPTLQAIEINRQRISDRMPKKYKQV